MALVVAVAVAVGAVFYHKAFRRRGKGKQRRIPNLRNYIEQLDIRPAEDAGTSLAGDSVVASDMCVFLDATSCALERCSFNHRQWTIDCSAHSLCMTTDDFHDGACMAPGWPLLAEPHATMTLQTRLPMQKIQQKPCRF